MAEDVLAMMRDLRRRADRIRQTIVEDYTSFLNQHTEGIFFRVPSDLPDDENDVGVTPTATALMALVTCEQMKPFYSDGFKVVTALEKVFASTWTTAGLDQNNPFTAAICIRAVGTLYQHKILTTDQVEALKRTHEDIAIDKLKVTTGTPPGVITDTWRMLHNRTAPEICKQFLEDPHKHLKVKSPATPALGYWMIDAADKLEIKFDSPPRFVSWATFEFRNQLSLVAANHHAMMDPIALAMSACLCSAINRVATRCPETHKAVLAEKMPTNNELMFAVDMFFQQQNDAGVWEKYFPLFHYPKGGANYCWHFEVLEAVVSEFPTLMNNSSRLLQLNHALKWLEENRLHYQSGGTEYTGWNSGGDISSIRKGEPESWSTGVAHMCLSKLQTRLSESIRLGVLDKYRDRIQHIRHKNLEKWEDYLDCEVPGLDADRASVKKAIGEEIVKPTEAAVKEQGLPPRGDEKVLPRLLSPNLSLDNRRSALLFGPPGTSKTALCEAIAHRLGWPFIELSPSDFLRGGLDSIYENVNEVFEDLSDLYGVVILFDEMDALVQSRDVDSGHAVANQLDVTQKFLTTSMLPKLLKLRSQGRTIFFMATNHQRHFDPAIKRAGRFDLLIRMGPPSTDEKLSGLKSWRRKESATDLQQAESRLRTIVQDEEDTERLGRFTWGEMKEFFDGLLRETKAATLVAALEAKSDSEVRNLIKDWAKKKITLCDESKDEPGALWEFEKVDKLASRIQ